MKAYLPLVALTLPALLAAQTSYAVFPKGFEKVQDDAFDADYLGRAGRSQNGRVSYVPMHIQTGYALADLGMPVLNAKALSYRRNNWGGNTMYKSTQTLAISMSHSPLDTTAYTNTFASNEGKVRSQVFGSGGKPAVLNWPEMRYVKNGQKPAPFTFKIPLTAPYLVNSRGGKSLCIDFSITKRVSTYTFNNTTYHAFLFLDAAGPSHGGRFEHSPYRWKCRFSNGNWGMANSYMSAGLTTLRAGARITSL